MVRGGGTSGAGAAAALVPSGRWTSERPCEVDARATRYVRVHSSACSPSRPPHSAFRTAARDPDCRDNIGRFFGRPWVVGPTSGDNEGDSSPLLDLAEFSEAAGGPGGLDEDRITKNIDFVAARHENHKNFWPRVVRISRRCARTTLSILSALDTTTTHTIGDSVSP